MEIKNMLPNPFISVVIPVYNPDESVCETIQSVFKQTCQSFEIIIVDDGSEIDAMSYIKRFDDKRIMYYKLEHKNANVARNFGIAKSQGQYIAMLDSDDLWLESHLEECINTLQNTYADGLYGSLLLRYADGSEKPFYVRNLNEGEQMINYLLSSRFGAQTSTLFFTRESARFILWDEALNRHQDYDFIVRYACNYQLIPKTKPTVIYRCSNKAKIIDFNSCIHFIEKNMKDIEPQLYNKYNLQMLTTATNRNACQDVIQHYKKEATRYKPYLSYYLYISIKNPQTWYQKLFYKIAYLFHILCVRVD